MRKLESGVRDHPLEHGSEAGASLFIVNPFTWKGIMTLLSTHPQTEDRVKRLQGLKL